MRHKYWILLGLMWCSSVAVGQDKVQRAEFERVVDYVNCELGKFFMARTQSPYTLDTFQTIEAEYGRSYEQLMVFIKGRQPQMIENGELAVAIDAYKERYDSCITNEELYNSLTDVFKNPKLDIFSQTDEFAVLKGKLIAAIYNDLKVKEAEATSVTPLGNWWQAFRQWEFRQVAIVVVVLIVLLIVLKAILWFRKYTKGSEISKLPSAKEKAQAEKPSISINEAYTEKKRQPQPTPPPVEEVAEVAMSEAEELPKARGVKEEKPKNEVFYMPYPSLDGTFYQHNRTSVLSENSAFHFTVKLPAYGLATFEVVSSEKVITDVFMDFEGTLKPACEIEGDAKIVEGMKRIVTVEAGIVQKRGGEQHWRLKQKVRVRFEY